MKNKILKGIAALAVAGTMASCSSDYLEQPPITYISDDKIAQSIEGAHAALYGLCQAMYIGQYGDWLRISNGEGYLRTLYGDSGSPDFYDSWLAGSQEDYQVWYMMRTDGNIANTFPWAYCYNLIFQANVILREIDKCPGEPSEVDFIKAQALSMRAHAFIRLMQIYGPRFEDSNNGEALCFVLRLQPGSENLPLASYAECIKTIYGDLDTAIELFEESGETRKYGFEPDINVARALYSRIALLNHDWQKAKDMAHEARAQYPIMTAEEFKAGFGEHNGEWLWYNLPDMDYNGYNSWGASFSCNGAYATAYNWSGAGNISWDFYKELYAKHPDDVRLELFWTPDKANKYVNLSIKESDFWDPKSINSEFLFCYGNEVKMTAAVALFMAHNTPAGYSGGYAVDTSLSDKDASNRVARQNWFNNKASIATNKTDGRVQFGAQIKFWSNLENLGASELAFIRSGELILTEAEAALALGDETTAKNCLNELNANRIPNYDCTSTGDALVEEVRTTRRIELWGEGDTWFSLKRWNVPVERRIWIQGDTSSNNMLPAYKGSYSADYCNGWRYEVPRWETNYNTEARK